MVFELYEDVIHLSEGDILQIKKNISSLKLIGDNIRTYDLPQDEKQTLADKITTAIMLTRRIEESNQEMHRIEYSVLMNIIGGLVDGVMEVLKDVEIVD